MRRIWFSGLLAAILVMALTPAAARAEKLKFDLVPASPAIASCLPDATARVTVIPRENRGFDSLEIKASGLPPDTDFAVFLTEHPADGTPPFGAVQYIADFTTNHHGKAEVTVHAVILEAFSSTLCDGSRVRKELNNITVWFADPAGDDVCFGAGGGPITPFDGDGVAGAAALSSNGPTPPLP